KRMKVELQESGYWPAKRASLFFYSHDPRPPANSPYTFILHPSSFLLHASGSAFDERFRDSLLHDFFMLIEDTAFPRDPAAPAARFDLFFQDARVHPNRVANEDGPLELPAPDADEGQRPHGRVMQGQTAADRQDQQAVGDGPMKRGRLGEFVID